MKDRKSCERKVAALLGGKCVPASGRTRGDAPDVLHNSLSVKVKSRKKLPTWIENAMKQAEARAKTGQVPIVALHQDGRRYADNLGRVAARRLLRLLERERAVKREHRKLTASELSLITSRRPVVRPVRWQEVPYTLPSPLLMERDTQQSGAKPTKEGKDRRECG